jgi:hypothetical protein
MSNGTGDDYVLSQEEQERYSRLAELEERGEGARSGGRHHLHGLEARAYGNRLIEEALEPRAPSAHRRESASTPNVGGREHAESQEQGDQEGDQGDQETVNP